jgi:aminoglycoside phosphotransferase (APT) family kinase protein
MDRVAGESIGPRVVRRPELATARTRLPAQMAAQLARIHAIDPTPLGFLPRPPAGRSPARQALDHTRRVIDAIGMQSPALEFGLRWLNQRAPACAQLTLIHGDFRIGNLLVGPEGLNAVIDWEFAHVGDPHEDLAWPCVRDWRFGNDALPVGGVGELAPYLSAYESASGRAIDHSTLRWWEIMGNLRWAATCHVQAHRHLSSADPSVEFASLGRRAAEMELEFLTLIEETEA